MAVEFDCDSLWYGADVVTMRDGRYNLIEDGAIAVKTTASSGLARGKRRWRRAPGGESILAAASSPRSDRLPHASGVWRRSQRGV